MIKLTAGLDAANKIIAWDYEGWTATRGGRPGPPANVATGILLGFPETPLTASPTTTPNGKPNTVDGSNTIPSYTIPSQRVLSHEGRLPLLAGPLRSPARIQNTFANESFMDELAHAAGEDPINFRLNHLADPRLIAVIQTVAKLANWEYRPSASQSGSGRFRAAAASPRCGTRAEAATRRSSPIARSTPRPARSPSTTSTPRRTAGQLSTPTA